MCIRDSLATACVATAVVPAMADDVVTAEAATKKVTSVYKYHLEGYDLSLIHIFGRDFRFALGLILFQRNSIYFGRWDAISFYCYEMCIRDSFKGSLVKVQVALAKGKKLYDKRQDIAKKDQRREACLLYTSESASVKSIVRMIRSQLSTVTRTCCPSLNLRFVASPTSS